ncbi:MAG: 16S rRNA (guanine(966)-N(2))-methyltransferase RsmD [Proteobacteria bacterium]|nr:16S rRNA (guanine(966)-N(2))-methyltransferase RsmD [Pseudomonadota bacterium]MBU1453244.1 16S rRNA (guanine(966)-N(2))-methyltransferase RsmD [Pseudomonadota bacterium]
MRIISGQARGRTLYSPGQSKTIRPTADRAKEAIFSIIGERIVSALVLDLFAGTGALGLEAWSRGARQVVFVDHHGKALELIRKNCSLCLQNMDPSLQEALIIIKHDLRRGLNLKFRKNPAPPFFDLIFLDPPYGKGLAKETLENINNSDLCGPNTLIIAEETSGEVLPDSFSHLVLSDHRRYGDTAFWFYTPKEIRQHSNI